MSKKIDWWEILRKLTSFFVSLPAYILTAIGASILAIVIVEPLNRQLTPALQSSTIVSPEQTINIVSASPTAIVPLMAFVFFGILLATIFIRAVFGSVVDFFQMSIRLEFVFKSAVGAFSWLIWGLMFIGSQKVARADLLWFFCWLLVALILVCFGLEALLAKFDKSRSKTKKAEKTYRFSDT